MHRGVAGSCQSPVSNEVSKARQVSREDGRAGSVWQGDTPRTGGHATGRGTRHGETRRATGTKPARKQPRLGGTGGAAERGGGRAGGCRAPPPRRHAALRDKAAELLGPGSTVTLE